MLDGMSRPNIIVRVLKRGRQKQKSQRQSEKHSIGRGRL